MAHVVLHLHSGPTVQIQVSDSVEQVASRLTEALNAPGLPGSRIEIRRQNEEMIVSVPLTSIEYFEVSPSSPERADDMKILQVLLGLSSAFRRSRPTRSS